MEVPKRWEEMSWSEKIRDRRGRLDMSHWPDKEDSAFLCNYFMLGEKCWVRIRVLDYWSIDLCCMTFPISISCTSCILSRRSWTVSTRWNSLLRVMIIYNKDLNLTVLNEQTNKKKIKKKRNEHLREKIQTNKHQEIMELFTNATLHEVKNIFNPLIGKLLFFFFWIFSRQISWKKGKVSNGKKATKVILSNNPRGFKFFKSKYFRVLYKVKSDTSEKATTIEDIPQF